MTEESRNKPLYMISVAAELTGMHPQTLRVYESKGLVNPKRSGGNTRLYSQADIERLELINQLTDEGINLAGVVRILDMKERAEARELEAEKLRSRVRQLEDELHELKMQKRITALAPRCLLYTSVQIETCISFVGRIPRSPAREVPVDNIYIYVKTGSDPLLGRTRFSLDPYSDAREISPRRSR